jgi:hypothetical protein
MITQNNLIIVTGSVKQRRAQIYNINNNFIVGGVDGNRPLEVAAWPLEVAAWREVECCCNGSVRKQARNPSFLEFVRAKFQNYTYPRQLVSMT